MPLGECYIVYDIDPDILFFDIGRFIFDIERKKAFDIVYDNNDIIARYRNIIFDIEETKVRYRQLCS